ncbi:SAM-dependent methyltransferase, partial [Nocardia salmonicida]|uniref:SAM-dependent methyltransferase n=1 Tax=Nocardia salmonicida TaxID=53431 RepID=UPI00365AA26B
MSSSRATKKQPGRILFVGSGPGDPALLTVRAREVLERAMLAFTMPTTACQRVAGSCDLRQPACVDRENE